MHKIQKILASYRPIIIPAALLVIAILLFIFAIFPAGKRVYTLASTLPQLNRDVRDLSTKLQELQNLDVTTLDSELTAVTSAIPLDRNIPSLFSTLDGASSKVGASVGDLSFIGGSLATGSATAATKKSSVVTKQGLSIIGFNMTVSGQIESIADFLTVVERVRRFIHLNTFTISIDQSLMAKSVIAAETYYAPSSSAKTQAAGFVPLSAAQQKQITDLLVYPDFSGALTQPANAGPIIVPPRSNPFSL